MTTQRPWDKKAEPSPPPPQSEGLARALKWAALGFKVFPCWPSDKSPIGQAVPHGFKDATTDTPTIERWWRMFPTALVGLPTGGSVAVVDIDLKLDNDGREVKNGFATLEKIGLNLPPTFTVKTRSGGEHRYYRCPEGGLPSSTDILRKTNGGARTGIDIRADGGYVIAWSDPDAEALASLAEWPAALVQAMEWDEQQRAALIEEPDELRDFGPVDPDVVRQALACIPAEDREDWRVVGMALKAEFGDAGRGLWDSWSQQSAKFNDKDQEKVWRSFRREGLGIGSLFHLAIGYGWVRQETPAEAVARAHWNACAQNMIRNFFAKREREAQTEAAALEAEIEAARPAKAPYVEPDWCRPDGLLERIARWILANSRRPNRPLAVAAAAMTLAVVMCRHMSGPTGLQTHLYMALLAGTGVGKDTPLRAPGVLLRAIELGAVVTSAKFSSDVAIEGVLADKPCALAVCDEIGSQLFSRMSSKRGSSHESAISGTLRELWGAAYGVHQTRNSKATRSHDITAPALSIWGASTLNEFYNTLSGGSLENGLLNRWLVVQGAPRGARRDEAEQSPPPQGILDALEAIFPPGGDLSGKLALSTHTAPEVTRTGWEDDVREAFKDFEESILDAMEDDTELENYLSRTAELALKLAHIHAVSRAGRDATITMRDWEWGRVFAEASGRFMAKEVADRMAENEKQANYKLVLRLVKEAGVATLRDLGRALRGKLDSRDLDAVLATLERDGHVFRETRRPEKQGRPSVIIRAV